MIVKTNIPGPHGRAPRCPAGMTLWAALDVEWSKNYRIKNGNVPFCYSVVYVAVPRDGGPVDPAKLPFSFTSVYVEDPDETTALLRSANDAVRTAFQAADHVTGHQFTSDLAVLANASAEPLKDVADARQAWKTRRHEEMAVHRVIDTRYDTDHVLSCKSRRLVDVCNDLQLDVTQPELRTKSMTALHRAYLETGAHEPRERISVLNLRHGLSTGIVALYSTGRGRWNDTLNINRMLAKQLQDTFGWLSHPTFTELL